MSVVILTVPAEDRMIALDADRRVVIVAADDRQITVER